jgi:hypothetical protein
MRRPEIAKVNMSRVLREAGNLVLNELSPLRRELKFDVHLAPSKVAASAGDGAFVKTGRVPAGAVVCIYPGTFVPPPPRWALPLDGWLPAGGKLLLHDPSPENAYLLGTSDGGAIDGEKASELPGVQLNRFAMAHKANHAGGCSPNVTSVSFAWCDALRACTPLDCPGDAERLPLPNIFEREGPWFYDYKAATVIMLRDHHSANEDDAIAQRLNGAAFVALREIEAGEEILLDYDLNGPPYPQWARDWYRRSI